MVSVLRARFPGCRRRQARRDGSGGGRDEIHDAIRKRTKGDSQGSRRLAALSSRPVDVWAQMGLAHSRGAVRLETRRPLLLLLQWRLLEKRNSWFIMRGTAR